MSDFLDWERQRERLTKAFARNEFLLYSQSIEKLRPEGENRAHTEIYVRLKDEERNILSPGTFLPILEHYRLGSKLDQYVLRRALVWHRGKRRNAAFVLHMNLCRGTLADPEFPSFVAAELKAAGLDGDSLCFEIPEVREPDDPHIGEFAKRLRAAGCSIAVGIQQPDYVTFRPAKHFAADYMKIDGSLIRHVMSGMESAAKLRALIRACRAFGIRTVAQHVEDRDTLTMLYDLGFDYAQGHEISRPAPMEVLV
jgi:EAL domain-containing protein (putative c-di-GMP-specific phosphodiesterase class I)